MNSHPAAQRSRPLWLSLCSVLLSILMTALAACGGGDTAPAPTISVQPADTSTVAGSAATLSVTASGTDIGYQWQSSSDGGTSWRDIAAATQASHTTPATSAADNGKRFRVIVSAGGISVTSSAVTLSVTDAAVAVAITVQPFDQSVTAGSAAAFTAAATGTPAPNLQWQRSTDGGASWSNIADASASTHNTGPTGLAQNGERYRLVASNGSSSATSNAALLSVTAAAQAPLITAQPANASVTAPAMATFTASASGVPTPTWQWQLSTDSGTTWANINGATAASYATPATAVADSGRRYRAVASNSAGTANSNAAVLTVTASATTPPAFAKIAAGESHTCAVKADATVACWGKGSSREVLPGSGINQDIPVTVPGLSGITQVAVGFQRSCALDANGGLLCWGRGNGTGIGTVTDIANVPHTGIKAIVLGAYHGCFIDAATTVQCWGDDSVGQLGQGSASITPAVNPVIVRRLNSEPLTGAVSLAAGSFYTCALKSDGDVVCWGRGAIGDGSPALAGFEATGTQLALRAIVPAVTGANAIASSGGHVCAAMAIGGIKCWGENSSGQLGNGNRVPQLLPISVADPQGLLAGVSKIAMEAKNTCAVRADPANGQVICWGSVAPNHINNLYTAPTAKGTSTQLISALSGGFEHTCALLADGAMECWGGNPFGQLGIGGTIGVFTGGPTPPGTSVIGGAIFWK